MINILPDVLQTKLVMPLARAELVARPRLIEQLDQGLHQRLTLICAPAGFGKTTLLSEWLGSSGDSPVAWVSLDEDDNDPARFLTYLICALATIGGIQGDELLALLQTPQPPPPKVVVTALISRLEAIPDRFVLALDDYHLITAQPVHEAMIFLLDHLPSSMRLVLISREDPPLPLSRLRGRAQLAEIRADDLRFTAAEVGQFLEQMVGITLSADQVRDLDTRTEGWIAGLQLAALAMKGRDDISGFIAAFTGSHRFVLDYLTEEVLSRQPEDIQQFLLETSILNRLCGPLCDAVTGRTDSQGILEQIERSNLFLLPLDDERYWYRYHHLFADMLRNRLSQAQKGELHHRASRWLANESLIDEAVSHAIAGKDYELAASVLEASGGRYFVESWGNFGMAWAAQIPDEVMRDHPLLALNTGMWHGYLGRAALAQDYVEHARVGLDKLALAESETEELLGYADTIEALSATISYDTERAISATENALRRLPAHRIRLRGTALLVKGYVLQRERRFDEAHEIYDEVIDIGTELRDFNMITRAMIHDTEIYLMEGRLRAAEPAYHALLRLVADEKQEHLLNVGIAYGELSILQFEQNQLDAAARLAALCIERCDHVIPHYALVGYAILARIHRLNGDVDACQRAVQNMLDILENFAAVPGRIYVQFITRLWISDAIFARFRQFMMEQRHLSISPYEAELLQLVTIRVCIDERTDSALAEAFQLVDDLRSKLEGSSFIGSRLQLLILEALALDAAGKNAEALNAVEAALTLAEPEGYLRIFADEGAPMAALLCQVKARGNGGEYVTKLLVAFDGGATPVSVTRSEQTIIGDIEPLSERELEVLRLIADGASNREIAEALFVSIGTVKKHLNNIFLKLDVHNRTQATATARQHNLL